MVIASKSNRDRTILVQTCMSLFLIKCCNDICETALLVSVEFFTGYGIVFGVMRVPHTCPQSTNLLGVQKDSSVFVEFVKPMT